MVVKLIRRLVHVPSSLPPPCSPSGQGEEGWSRTVRGCAGTKGPAGENSAENPPDIKFLGSLRT